MLWTIWSVVLIIVLDCYIVQISRMGMHVIVNDFRLYLSSFDFIVNITVALLDLLYGAYGGLHLFHFLLCVWPQLL
jgi:hypothetical protein